MRRVEHLNDELLKVTQEFFSINVEEDNKTIKYLYLNGKFDDHELLLIGAIFSKYKGLDGHEVVS